MTTSIQVLHTHQYTINITFKYLLVYEKLMKMFDLISFVVTQFFLKCPEGFDIYKMHNGPMGRFNRLSVGLHWCV